MNKFSFIANEPTVIDYQELTNKIKINLSKYLSDYSNLCNFILSKDAIIFGGAVRDSIAELEIHDIDILVLPNSCKTIVNMLKALGFKYIDKFNMDIATMYSGSLINLPLTFYRNDAFIQLIRPRTKINNKETLIDIAKNVDLSCCGVFLDSDSLHETFPKAIEHCQKKIFRVLVQNKLYNAQRCLNRIEKLTQRGWTQIEKEEFHKRRNDIIHNIV